MYSVNFDVLKSMKSSIHVIENKSVFSDFDVFSQ